MHLQSHDHAMTDFEALDRLIGKTPLVRLDLEIASTPLSVYAKAEMYNYSGSIKDRMVLSILRRARDRGELRAGQRIVEATSGNSGIATAALGRALGHPVTIFMPDWMSVERRALIESYGAELRLISAEEGGFLGAIEQAERCAQSDGAFVTEQFSSTDNCLAHYESTGPELHEQVAADGAALGAFVAAVGTGGTVMGTGRYLKERDGKIAIHAVEPAESPTLRVGRKIGSHRIQGVTDAFVPAILDLASLDSIVDVHDGDAILMAQKLGRELGLGVGISSGANLVAAITVAQARDDGLPVATVLADNNLKYMSTDLAQEEPVRADYVTPRVRFRSAATIR